MNNNLSKVVKKKLKDATLEEIKNEYLKRKTSMDLLLRGGENDTGYYFTLTETRKSRLIAFQGIITNGTEGYYSVIPLFGEPRKQYDLLLSIYKDNNNGESLCFPYFWYYVPVKTKKANYPRIGDTVEVSGLWYPINDKELHSNCRKVNFSSSDCLGYLKRDNELLIIPAWKIGKIITREKNY